MAESALFQGDLGHKLGGGLRALAATAVAAAILWRAVINPAATSTGDLIVVIYLLGIPAAMPPMVAIFSACLIRLSMARIRLRSCMV